MKLDSSATGCDIAMLAIASPLGLDTFEGRAKSPSILPSVFASPEESRPESLDRRG